MILELIEEVSKYCFIMRNLPGFIKLIKALLPVPTIYFLSLQKLNSCTVDSQAVASL
jgi:hypothetical protein